MLQDCFPVTIGADQSIQSRYASLRIKGDNLDSGTELHIGYAKCQVDSPYKIMDRHLSTLFGEGNNLATLLATPSLALTGPLGIDNFDAIKNSNITLTKNGGTFTFNGVSLGALSHTDVGAKSSSYVPSLSDVTTALDIINKNVILNSNVSLTKSNGTWTFNNGSSTTFTKSDLNLGNVGNYSPTDLG